MSKTSENLKNAFAGESQANRKYLAWGKKANDEGFPQIARLFKAVAAAEAIHATSHLRAMDGIKTTAENLAAAMSGENYEVVSMYPPMRAQAEAEGDRRAERSFRWAWEVEKVHEGLYKKALEYQTQGKDLPETHFYVCPVCGYTHEGPMEGPCPICNTPAEKFEKID